LRYRLARAEIRFRPRGAITKTRETVIRRLDGELPLRASGGLEGTEPSFLRGPACVARLGRFTSVSVDCEEEDAKFGNAF
jgi:hypothetical protein